MDVDRDCWHQHQPSTLIFQVCTFVVRLKMKIEIFFKKNFFKKTTKTTNFNTNIMVRLVCRCCSRQTCTIHFENYRTIVED